MDINIKNTTTTGDCVFSQNILLEIAAGSALSSSLTSLFNDTAISEALAKTTSTYETKQQEDPTPATPSSGGTDTSGNGMSTENAIVVGGIVMLIIGIALLAFKMYAIGVLVMLIGICMIVLPLVL